MSSENIINIVNPFTMDTVSSGASAYSQPYNLNELLLNGFGGIQFKLTAAGTGVLAIECSNDKDPLDSTQPFYLGFTAPASNATIATGITTGTYFYTPTEFKFPPCKWLRFKVTAAGGDVTNVTGTPSLT